VTNADDTRELLKVYGQRGMEEAAATRKPSIEDILRGMGGVDADYQLLTLINLYERALEDTGFAEGDLVRVRRSSWYLGDSAKSPGWRGYAQMIADEVAVLVKLRWNPHYSFWAADLEFPTDYRYTDYMGGTFYVKDRSVVLSFDIERIKKVGGQDG
jgi:hypothetical protein